MNVKTIVLDFDGTIGDTCGLIVRTMQQTIARLELPRRTDRECASMIGLPLRQTFTELIPMSAEMGERCERVYRELFAKNNVPGSVPMFPHVAATIKELHARGLTLTIASSRLRGSLVDFLEKMKLMPYISYIVSASDIENAKPAPDMVIDILEHVGGKAGETLVVGDTVFDVEMGRRAGALTCGVTYGNGTREDLAGADFVIDDFGLLLDLVAGEN